MTPDAKESQTDQDGVRQFAFLRQLDCESQNDLKNTKEAVDFLERHFVEGAGPDKSNRVKQGGN